MILLKGLKGYFAEDGYKFCFIGSGKGMESKEKKKKTGSLGTWRRQGRSGSENGDWEVQMALGKL